MTHLLHYHRRRRRSCGVGNSEDALDRVDVNEHVVVVRQFEVAEVAEYSGGGEARREVRPAGGRLSDTTAHV